MYGSHFKKMFENQIRIVKKMRFFTFLTSNLSKFLWTIFFLFKSNAWNILKASCKSYFHKTLKEILMMKLLLKWGIFFLKNFQRKRHLARRPLYFLIDLNIIFLVFIKVIDQNYNQCLWNTFIRTICFFDNFLKIKTST